MSFNLFVMVILNITKVITVLFYKFLLRCVFSKLNFFLDRHMVSLDVNNFLFIFFFVALDYVLELIHIRAVSLTAFF